MTPVIHTLLDTDLYKFTMLQAFLHGFPANHAVYEFVCRTAPAHPLAAREDVLQRIVESMADVERSRDVGRRHDDRPRLGVGPVGPEQAAALPVRVPALLDDFGVEGLGKLAHAEARLAMPRCSINLARVARA